MTVPVIVVDDHHHCLPEIHLAIRQRRLPFSQIHVLHVDAHPDLSFSAATKTDVIFEPEILYDRLDESVAGIAEFLMPLVFAGHVNQITWLKPSWARQMPIGSFKQLAVGKRLTNGAMGVTSELPHFVEDDLYCSLEEMDSSSTKKWDLFAIELNTSHEATAIATEAIKTARQNSRAFLLDIDLDYFSTWNPFRRELNTYIDEAAIKTVTQVFSTVRYKQSLLDLMQAKQREFERKVFCQLMKRLEAADAMELASKRTSEWTQIVQELIPLYAHDVNANDIFKDLFQILEQYRDQKEVRHEIWTAGPFLDLPSHETSLEEIISMVSELEQFLRTSALDAPAIVTIAKSTGDKFLPPHQVNFVLTCVLEMLARTYGELSTKSTSV